MKGIIFYTTADLRKPFVPYVRELIKNSGLPITSCSLKPIDFGKNIVLNDKKGPVTMFKQILTALENAEQKYVFFCEHDVLYHPSHFEFIPPRDDTFYYNTNIWRWDYLSDKVSTYDHLVSVSGICVNRELAIDFYKNRLKIIYERGFDKIWTWGNPVWARKMGYEPGKNVSKYGEYAKKEERRSKYPNIDIRHTRTMTPAKMNLEDFRRKPVNWQESTIDKLPGWDIEYLKKRCL